MKRVSAARQVSDREHLMARDPAHAAEQLAEATEMIERGDGEEILYRDSGTMRSAALLLPLAPDPRWNK